MAENNPSVNNKRISFELCHVELYDIRVFRSFNGKKQVIYDSRLDGKKNLINLIMKVQKKNMIL